MSPWTESHSELEIIFKLKEGARLNYAKVEFTPAKMEECYKPETYNLKIDENREPDWFDDEMNESVADKMRKYIKSIVVDGDVKLLIGGQFIIAPNAKIESAHTLLIQAICGGNVGSISGSAKVGSIYGSAKVGGISGSAKVGGISGSANVGSISGSAKVGSIYGSAKVGYIYGSAKVGSIYGSAKVDGIYGSANVGYIYGSAKVGYISGSAKIEKDERTTK